MRNGEYELVIAPVNYPGKKYRGKYCYEHHLVFWEKTKMIPKEGECIHHKDGNKRNNIFENLELKTIKDHGFEHSKQKGKKMVELKCPECGKIFHRPRSRTHFSKKGMYTSCSLKCNRKFTGKNFGMKKHITKEGLEAIKNNVIREYHSRVPEWQQGTDC